MSIKRSLTI